MTSQLGNTLLLVVGDVEDLEFRCRRGAFSVSQGFEGRQRNRVETYVESIRSRFESLAQFPSFVESAPETGSY